MIIEETIEYLSDRIKALEESIQFMLKNGYMGQDFTRITATYDALTGVLEWITEKNK